MNNAVDPEELFDAALEEVYGRKVHVGGVNFSTVEIIKTLDNIAYQEMLNCYVSDLIDDGQLFTPDNGLTFYWSVDLEEIEQIFKKAS
jgi:hypothetical protein